MMIQKPLLTNFPLFVKLDTHTHTMEFQIGKNLWEKNDIFHTVNLSVLLSEIEHNE